MPEPVTFAGTESPALSPENEQMLEALQSGGDPTATEEQQLLAGKYKSVEDLEKAYQEAQRKLSQRGQVEETEDEAAEADDSEEEKPQSADAKEIYGDFIGSRLEEAEIDFNAMNTRWQETGQLADDDYSQLEEAGFTRDMVDAYLSGLQYKAAQDTALTVKEITALKQEYGGDKGYSDMLEWAAENLSDEEIKGFNEIVTGNSTMAAVRMAVSGLYAKYTSKAGVEPKLIGGRSPKASTDKFESTAQLVEAMKDPRYGADPAYRRKIEEKLARSSIF
jgi:hypothetical protein